MPRTRKPNRQDKSTRIGNLRNATNSSAPKNSMLTGGPKTGRRVSPKLSAETQRAFIGSGAASSERNARERVVMPDNRRKMGAEPVTAPAYSPEATAALAKLPNSYTDTEANAIAAFIDTLVGNGTTTNMWAQLFADGLLVCLKQSDATNALVNLAPPVTSPVAAAGASHNANVGYAVTTSAADGYVDTGFATPAGHADNQAFGQFLVTGTDQASLERSFAASGGGPFTFIAYAGSGSDQMYARSQTASGAGIAAVTGFLTNSVAMAIRSTSTLMESYLNNVFVDDYTSATSGLPTGNFYFGGDIDAASNDQFGGTASILFVCQQSNGGVTFDRTVMHNAMVAYNGAF